MAIILHHKKTSISTGEISPNSPDNGNISGKNSISTPQILLQQGYQYIELIGEGANGKTYKAQNLKTREIVAIKTLKFSDNLKNYELFQREAEILKSINLPGTPKFYDYITNETEFTECWLIQEYINGESIYDKLKNGDRFKEMQTLEAILQAADIVRMLQTMYAPPIIHRDIKPSNILIQNSQQDIQKLYLIDFGAVANPQRRGCNSTVAGTVGYMAPEQLIGDCTIQSDYYALGATALHMMTGIAPSEFPSDGFSLQFEGRLKSIIPDIHPETIALLHKLLAPNPSDRPKDAHELLKYIYDTITQIDRSIPEKQVQIQKQILKAESIARDKNFVYLLLCFLIPMFIALIAKDTLSIFAALSPLLLISIFFWIYANKRKLMRLHKELDKLPNYNKQGQQTRRFALPKEIKTESDSGKNEAEGIIESIFGDIIEYTVTLDHKSHVAFYRNMNLHPYKIGQKLAVQYHKDGENIHFYVKE